MNLRVRRSLLSLRGTLPRAAAAQYGHLRVVRLFIEYGADASTAAHNAADNPTAAAVTQQTAPQRVTASRPTLRNSRQTTRRLPIHKPRALSNTLFQVPLPGHGALSLALGCGQLRVRRRHHRVSRRHHHSRHLDGRCCRS